MIFRVLYLLLLSCCSQYAIAGKKLKVLFIGNSYTYVNNMPQIVADIASSMDDTLIWDMEAPGGAFLLDHYITNPPTTINKIKAGYWNYVVMQEQSMQTAVPDSNMNASFFPAGKLDSLINLYNSCVETIFYQTWGRKNGDSFACKYYTKKHNWPYYCTYNTMDSLIRIRYQKLADTNNAIISPVGSVWKYLRNNYPNIELYDVDESHPSYAGSYAAACAFYTTIFRRRPTIIKFNGILNGNDATSIRTATEKIVYDSMSYWHIGQHKTEAIFTQNINSGTVSFNNSSVNAQKYYWDFGDGQTAGVKDPIHTYNTSGSYNVMLVATNTFTGCKDTSYSNVTVFTTSISETIKCNGTFTLSPNPSNGSFVINTLNNSARVIVSNIYGQIVYDKVFSNYIKVDVCDKPKGLYTVHIMNINGEWDTKVIIQ